MVKRQRQGYHIICCTVVVSVVKKQWCRAAIMNLSLALVTQFYDLMLLTMLFSHSPFILHFPAHASYHIILFIFPTTVI